jgi:hypothetical protein
MSLLNFFDRSALKIQITFAEFEREIHRYELTAQSCNISISLSNPHDLIRFLELKLSEFRNLRSKCFTEVIFKSETQSLSIEQAERYMMEMINRNKANHKIVR